MALKDKVVIVTGASRGIGRTTAIAFAKEGAKVVVNYYNSGSRAREVEKEIMKYSECICLKCDVSDSAGVRKMAGQVIKKFGKIDVLINNAGLIIPRNWDKLDDKTWQRMMNVNLKGQFNCIQAIAPHMKKQKSGRIINITSTFGFIGASAVIAYTTAKAGVINLTKSFAKELAPDINVNAIAPGIIDTDMTKGAGKRLIKQFIEETPLKRLGKPEEIAEAAVFLAKSDFITGEVLVVDGGHSLR